MYGSLLSGTDGETLLLRQRKKTALWSVCLFTEQARYFIALAANGPLPPTQSSFFDYPLEKAI